MGIDERTFRMEQEYMDLHEQGLSPSEIAKRFNLDVSTVYKSLGKIAKSNGVPILTITSNKNSPLAKLSDAVLYTASSGTAISDSMYETQLSQTIIIDALCSYIRHHLDRDGDKKYFKLTDILNSHNVND